MNLISQLAFFLVVIPSAIFHEYMHGWVADRLGDPTARYAGRLTLDPRAHVDLWGTFLIPLGLFFATGGQFMFAYAKPVPYNPYNLRDQRVGPLMIALAGPISNFILAAIFSALLRAFPATPFSDFLFLIVYANVLLGVFNLLPIPPLDGSKLLYALLPSSMERIKMTLDQFGFIILIGFMVAFSGVIHQILTTVLMWFVGGF